MKSRPNRISMKHPEINQELIEFYMQRSAHLRGRAFASAWRSINGVLKRAGQAMSKGLIYVIKGILQLLSRPTTTVFTGPDKRGQVPCT